MSSFLNVQVTKCRLFSIFNIQGPIFPTQNVEYLVDVAAGKVDEAARLPRLPSTRRATRGAFPLESEWYVTKFVPHKAPQSIAWRQVDFSHLVDVAAGKVEEVARLEVRLQHRLADLALSATPFQAISSSPRDFTQFQAILSCPPRDFRPFRLRHAISRDFRPFRPVRHAISGYFAISADSAARFQAISGK